MRSTVIVIALVSAFALQGCGPDKVSHETLETERSTARANAVTAARHWRAQSAAFAELDIVARGDSTQSEHCPMGDGWASIDLINKHGVVARALKCSTHSLSIGCRTDRPSEEGTCQRSLPTPLPRVAQ